MGTLLWREMGSLTVKEHGAEVDYTVEATGKFFLGSQK